MIFVQFFGLCVIEDNHQESISFLDAMELIVIDHTERCKKDDLDQVFRKNIVMIIH